MGIMNRTPVMGGARITGIMGLMRRVRVMPVVPIVMRLSRRAGQAKGRGRNQGRRRQTSKVANSKVTVTQGHERALSHSRNG